MTTRLIPYKIATRKNLSYYKELVQNEILRFSESTGGQVNLGARSAREALAEAIVDALSAQKGLN